MKVLIVDNKQNISNPLSTFLKVKGFENVVTNDEKKDLIRVKVRNLKSLVEEIYEFRKFLNLKKISPQKFYFFEVLFTLLFFAAVFFAAVFFAGFLDPVIFFAGIMSKFNFLDFYR